MSAITGIFMRNGKDVDPQLMKKMNDKLSHRGPDGSAIWCDGPVGLGHQMLWTTPESLHEVLPLEEDGLVITADARIDNRAELSEKLGIRDEEDVADSYFILKAYAKWGEDCPDKLLGDFAFVIWDKNEEKLFCARDHMGVKPFYYYLDDDMFVFGTEIKALFKVEGVPREINERKVALYLMKDTMDTKTTFYKDINSFLAAHYFKIDKNKYKKKRYWKLDPNLEIKMGSEEEYVQAFREIFEKSVKCRLRSSYKIGFELSGGLDSSSIVCMTSKIFSEKGNANETINTFSSVYDAVPECDERYYIKKVLNKYKINSTFINGDNISPLKDIKKVLWHQDQPFFSPHLTNQIESYKKMRDMDIRIIFSGEGGDQIVSHGNNYLKELTFKFKWKKLISEINGLSNNFNESKYEIIKENIIFPAIPYSIKKFIKLFLKKRKVNFELNKTFLKRLGMTNEDNQLNNLEKLTSKEYHYFVINHPLAQTVFGIMDRSIAGFKIEQRYPFFDKRMVEFCYSLPTEMKLKFGWNRYIMRLAMENILPEEVQWRPGKANLNVSFKRNLMLFEKDTILEFVNDNYGKIEEYVNKNNLKKILEENLKGKENNLFNLWLIILLNSWIKKMKKSGFNN